MQDKTNPFAFYAGLHLLFAFYANIVKGECRDKRELYFRFDYAEPNPIFVFTNIAKGECRDKRELYFRFDYAEPNPVFVFTNIVKGECKGKRKSYFRLGFAETSPTLYKYRYFFGGQTRRIV